MVRRNIRQLILLLLMSLISSTSFARVEIEYGWSNLPGIPSTDPVQYESELISWIKTFATRSTEEKPYYPALGAEMITLPYHGGHINAQGEPQSVTYEYTDKNGNLQTGVYYDVNTPIWQMMRDIIFLETLQHSVKWWESQYIDKLSTATDVRAEDAYDDALKILNEFQAYQDNTNGGSHNPFITAFLGAGNTTYGVTPHAVFTTDGTLDNYIDGRVVYLMSGGILGKDIITPDYKAVFGFNKLGLTQLGLDYIINFFKNVGWADASTAKMASLLIGGTMDVLSGGLVMVLAPAKVYYDSMDYLISTLENAAKGTFLLNYYYLSSAYPEELKNRVSPEFISDTGEFDYRYYPQFTSYLANDILATDPKLNALYSYSLRNLFNLCMDHTTTCNNEKAATAINGIAQMFLMAKTLDISYLKREVAMFAFATYAKKHELFGPINTYSVNSFYNKDVDIKVEFANVTWESDTYWLNLKLRLPKQVFASDETALGADTTHPVTLDISSQDEEIVNEPEGAAYFKLPLDTNNTKLLQALANKTGLIEEYTLDIRMDRFSFASASGIHTTDGALTHRQKLQITYENLSTTQNTEYPYVEYITENGKLDWGVAGQTLKICPHSIEGFEDMNQWAVSALLNRDDLTYLTGTVENGCLSFITDGKTYYLMLPANHSALTPPVDYAALWLGKFLWLGQYLAVWKDKQGNIVGYSNDEVITNSGTTQLGDYVQIEVGATHTCGVKKDGSVYCWGGNSDDQAIPPIGNFTQVSAGGNHTCGVKIDGSVACWGDNPLWESYTYTSYGQATPPTGSFTQVSAGGSHTCGVKTDGSVACWGNNEYGKATPPTGSFTQVSAGGYHTCGVKTDGSVACWGSNTDGKATPPTDSFTQVSAGGYHTCGVKTDGSVACWGNNTAGQATPPTDSFTQVSAGSTHTCGVETDGSVVCWGTNTSGQAISPTGSFTQVSADYNHTCGVRTDGRIDCWGYNEYGQATPPTDTDNFTQITSGEGNKGIANCGIKNDGSVACWRSSSGKSTPTIGNFTQLTGEGKGMYCGIKTDSSVDCFWDNNNTGKFALPTGSFTQISVNYYACGVKTDGSVACWKDKALPTPTGSFTQVSVGYPHACGVKTDGSVACWNSLSTSTVAGDSSASTAVPPTPPIGSFTQISSLNSYFCGIKTDGSVACWGNSYATSPTGSFTQISIGNYAYTFGYGDAAPNYACGVKTDGSVACWGAYPSYSSAGAGFTESPTGSFTQVGTSQYYACGVKTDGSIACWGRYENSSIWGNSSRSMDALLPPTGSFTQIEGNFDYRCGLKTDGKMVCWDSIARNVWRDANNNLVSSPTTEGTSTTTPTITALSPTTAELNQSKIFTLTGTNLNNSLKFNLLGCTNINEQANGNTTQRQFQCTPQEVGVKTGVIRNQTGTILHTFSVNVTNPTNDISNLPRVTAISPLKATLGQTTIFTLTGTNLVDNMGFSINDCTPSSYELAGGNSTQRQFQCTPVEAGSKSGIVKDHPGGMTLYSFAVQITDPTKPTITISSISPLIDQVNETAIFTVTGTNLPDGMGFTVADCEHSNYELAGGTSTQRQFQCTQYGLAGEKYGIVKDMPNGTVLYEFKVQATDGTGVITPNAEVTLLLGTTVIDGTTTIDLGTATINTYATKTFSIQNNSGSALTISNISLPVGFQLVGTLPIVIGAGQFDVLTIKVDTTQLTNFSGLVSLTTNNLSQSLISFPVTVDVKTATVSSGGTETPVTYPTANLVDTETGLSVTTVNLGITETGSELLKSFTLKNTGSVPLVLSNLVLPEGFSLVGTFPSEIAIGQVATIQVQVTTNTVGTYSGTLSFNTNDPNHSVYKVTLTAQVVAPAITFAMGETGLLNGETVDVVLNSENKKTFVIRNTTTSTLYFSDLTLPTGFSLSGRFLAATASLPVGGADIFTIEKVGETTGGMLSFKYGQNSNTLKDFTVTLTVSETTTPPEFATIMLNGTRFNLPSLSAVSSLTLSNTLPNIKFAGGISVKGGAFAKSKRLQGFVGNPVVIAGSLQVDSSQIGQDVDIIAIGVYQPLPMMAGTWYMMDGVMPLVWTGDFAKLTARQTKLTLQATQSIVLYEGEFVATGQLSIYFGYRLNDGQIIYSAESIDITIE
ncbi:hypothetical protein BegalDRAFT_2446 [Beggiatoa alba B18LD]|uniref:non-specific serine/threonine protein kinase n=1 Tax=Beggiatoa alba B18LD TaxID=395493 RepID=I3CI54_9GAMM|nr:choice-of-anchor D domain-containing protein [Beggiatoa alba]EIJ43297.1 hypothetical protein BegalDRAFT_2446 [Beggiatoa alba B18LD]